MHEDFCVLLESVGSRVPRHRPLRFCLHCALINICIRNSFFFFFSSKRKRPLPAASCASRRLYFTRGRFSCCSSGSVTGWKEVVVATERKDPRDHQSPSDLADERPLMSGRLILRTGSLLLLARHRDVAATFPGEISKCLSDTLILQIIQTQFISGTGSRHSRASVDFLVGGCVSSDRRKGSPRAIPRTLLLYRYI